MRIRLGHSPDPDDAFMFWALAEGAIDTRGFEFEHVLRDIQTLNEWALEGRREHGLRLRPDRRFARAAQGGGIARPRDRRSRPDDHGLPRAADGDRRVP